MSHGNVDALRAVYEEWDRGNFGAGIDLLDPDVLFMPRTDLADGGRYLGPGGMAEFKVRRQQYGDRVEALEAVGLSEQDAHADY